MPTVVATEIMQEEHALDDILADAPPPGAEPDLRARRVSRRGQGQPFAASPKSFCAFSTCSSVSGTNFAASAISVALSIRYCMNASISGFASDSFFA